VVLDHLGETYIKLNDPAQARNAWQKALELDPTLKSIGEKLKTLP
jgi:predicted negative regulator of RcsB-dependent stress response